MNDLLFTEKFADIVYILIEEVDEMTLDKVKTSPDISTDKMLQSLVDFEDIFKIAIDNLKNKE